MFKYRTYNSYAWNIKYFILELKYVTNVEYKWINNEIKEEKKSHKSWKFM